MENMELISVIVPVYNVEKYLHRCIDSICRQTYRELEIILIDDGSTDNSLAICNEWKRTDTRIRVIQKQNGGLSSARNTGIDNASGQYLMFIDSDDYISAEMVEKLHTALLQSAADLSICNFKYVDEKGLECSEDDRLPINNDIISGEVVLKTKMFEPKNWYWVIAWNKLYKRELFEITRYPDGKLHEDEYVIHEILAKCKKIACVSDMLYYYVQRQESIMGSQNRGSIRHLDGVEAYYCRTAFYQKNEEYTNIIVQTLLKGIEEYQKFNYRNTLVLQSKEYKVRVKKLQKQYRAIVNKFNQVHIESNNKITIYMNYCSLYWAWKIGFFKRKLLLKSKKR